MTLPLRTKRSMLPLVLGLLGVPWSLPAQDAPKPVAPTLVIKAAHLLDPAAGTVRDDVAVVVEGD